MIAKYVPNHLARRAFVAASGGLLLASSRLRAASGPQWKADPFSVGFASGSPSPDGFVLWTRLAPEPENYDAAAPAGMTGPAVSVSYEIASDPQMKTIIRRGAAMADPAYAYSVHAEVSGLETGRPYWYRFIKIGRAHV